MKRMSTRILTVLVGVLVTAGPASAGLIALYRFEDNLDDTYSNNLDGDYGTWSGGSFTGGGTPSYGSDSPYSGARKSVSLEGANDAIDLGTSGLLNPSGAWSFAAWTKITAAGLNYWITEHGDATDVSAEIHMNGGVNGVKVTTFDGLGNNNGANSNAGSNPNVMDGKWYHIAATMDTTGNGGDGLVRIYINGVLEATSTQAALTIMDTITGNTYLGSDDNGDYAGYTGYMDDAAFFDHALSSSEISTIMTGDFTAYGAPAMPLLPIIALYRFDGNLLDSSFPSDLHGDYGTWSGNTFTGGQTPTYVSSTAFAGADRAVSLEAAADAIDLSNSSLLNPSDAMSFVAWIKTSSAVGNSVIGARYTWAGGPDPSVWEIHINNTSTAKWLVFATDGTYAGVTTSFNLMDGAWHHIAFTCDTAAEEGTARFYVDGNLETSDAALRGKDIRQSALRTFLGSGSLGGLGAVFNGVMDDAAFFGHALTQAEIDRIMTGDFSAYALVPTGTLITIR